jgi:hypothetical protein
MKYMITNCFLLMKIQEMIMIHHCTIEETYHNLFNQLGSTPSKSFDDRLIQLES